MQQISFEILRRDWYSLFNIGFSEFLILAVIILICVDPRKLPDLARYVGRLIREFKKATNDLKINELMNPEQPPTVQKKIDPPPAGTEAAATQGPPQEGDKDKS